MSSRFFYPSVCVGVRRRVRVRLWSGTRECMCVCVRALDSVCECVREAMEHSAALRGAKGGLEMGTPLCVRASGTACVRVLN